MLQRADELCTYPVIVPFCETNKTVRLTSVGLLRSGRVPVMH
jgi:hypothetical protein